MGHEPCVSPTRWRQYCPKLTVKSTDTLQWKLLHYTLQVTNSKTTWVKGVLESWSIWFFYSTYCKYFTYTKYWLKEALETFHLKTVTLWRSWENRHREGSMCRYIMEKLEQTISQKSKGTKNRMTGKQTTITFNNSERSKQTLGLYIHRRLTSLTFTLHYIYI